MIQAFKQALIAVRETFFGIFLRDYEEDTERAELLDEFLKYDCICEANAKGDKTYSGYCPKHKTDWI